MATLVCLSSAVAQKHVPAGKYPEVEENHAQEAQEWLQHFTNPADEPNYDEVQARGFAQMRQMDNRPAMKSQSSAAWVEVAKSQEGRVSGRASCIAFDPTNPQILYLGTITGGLWKSTDFGANWVSLSDGSWKTLVIGGVAVDPQQPLTIYAGTGAPLSDVGGGGNQNGVGVYKSTDGGLNWTLLPGSPVAAISQVEVNWGNSNIVYVGASGVRRSTDGGQTWQQTTSMGGATSIAMDPNDASIIYASAGGAVRKSMDSGATWTDLSGFTNTGLLSVVTMSKSSSDTLYLSMGTWSGASYLQLSTDGGSTWKMVSQGANYLGQQPNYANAVATSPTNPAVVVAGGLDIYSSTTAGSSLHKRTVWTSSNSSSDFTHADIHVLKYDPYTNPPTLFALSDGGVYYSTNNAQTWSQRMNATLGTFQFVGGDASTTADGNLVFLSAGAQDNGTSKFSVGSSSYYTSIVGGDGGTVVIPADANANYQAMYGTYVYDVLYHSRDGGVNWPDSPQPINILEQTPIQTSGEHAPFYMEYDACDADADVVAVCGSTNLFLSTDGGATYQNDFPKVTNTGQPGSAVSGAVATVHIAKINSQFVFIGTTANTMYYSTDQGATWNKTKTSLGARPTSITSDPYDETHLFMTVAASTSKHFYVSTDTGRTWTATATNLPALNYRRVAFDGTNIFVGNDYGVLRSADNGKTWYPVADGMPLVMITSLRVRGHYLIAGTYGRGMFYVDLNQLPAVPGSTGGVTAGAPANGVSITSVYPSVVNTGSARSTVQYTLANDAHASITVYDVMGREERVIANEWMTKGSHDQAMDLAGLPAGNHYVRLTADGLSVTKSVTIE